MQFSWLAVQLRNWSGAGGASGGCSQQERHPGARAASIEQERHPWRHEILTALRSAQCAGPAQAASPQQVCLVAAAAGANHRAPRKHRQLDRQLPGAAGCCCDQHCLALALQGWSGGRLGGWAWQCGTSMQAASPCSLVTALQSAAARSTPNPPSSPHQPRLLQCNACGEARRHQRHHLRRRSRHSKRVLGSHYCPLSEAAVCHGGNRLPNCQSLWGVKGRKLYGRSERSCANAEWQGKQGRALVAAPGTVLQLPAFISARHLHGLRQSGT